MFTLRNSGYSILRIIYLIRVEANNYDLERWCNMYKLIAMDVDNTAAQTNMPVLYHNVKCIERLREKSIEVMLISGKSTSYLSGLARQLGLNDLLLSGENGVVINLGHHYPPKKVFKINVSEHQKDLLNEIKHNLDETFGEKLWYQPNEIQIAAFHYDQADLKKALNESVETMFKGSKYTDHLKYYIHSDCVDILPKQISKGNCLKMYMDEKSILSDEVITIGDGINDISMFKVSDISIGIGDSKAIETTLRYKGITEALNYVELELIK